MTQVLGARQPFELAPAAARVAVVGGAPLLAHGIASTLEAENQLVCEGWIPTVEAALAGAGQVLATVDVVVLITDSPSREASLLLSRLRELVAEARPDGMPEQGQHTRHDLNGRPQEHERPPAAPKLLLLTSNERSDELFASLQAGAAGYGILGQLAPPDLRGAALHLLRWGSWLCPVALEKLKAAVAVRVEGAPAGRPPRGRSTLSERELEVLRLKALGHRQQQIASTLHIAPCTVKTYIRRTCDKLEVHSCRDAIRIAIDRGLIPDRRR